MGGAPALAGHNTACGGVFSGVVSKIFAVKKKNDCSRCASEGWSYFSSGGPSAPGRRFLLKAARPGGRPPSLRRPMFVPHAGARGGWL